MDSKTHVPGGPSAPFRKAEPSTLLVAGFRYNQPPLWVESAHRAGFRVEFVDLEDNFEQHLQTTLPDVILFSDHARRDEALRIARQRAGRYVFCGFIGGPNPHAANVLSDVDWWTSEPVDTGSLTTFLHLAARVAAAGAAAAKHAESLAEVQTNLEVASRRFEELFHRIPVACFTMGADGTVFEWNAEAERRFGVDSASVFMRNVVSLLGKASQGFWTQSRIESLFEGNKIEGVEWTFQEASGDVRHFLANAYPFAGPTGSFVGAVCANVDISDRIAAERKVEEQMIEMAELNRKLEMLSVTDGLTGLWNRRYFQKSLEIALRELGNEGRPLSMIMLDVDHFKQYNDSFGHVAGDAVLRAVATILKSKVAEPGFVARFGGEEFAVVLPGACRKAAEFAAEELRKTIENHPWADRPVTASFGVSTTIDTKLPAKSLIEAADGALYDSKAEGRNRVRFSNPKFPAAPAA